MKAKYIQLAQQLRWQLRQMEIEGKTRLPSEAELCQRYSCSRQTVRKALEELEQENLIIKRKGSGSYLSDGARSRQVAVVTDCDDRYIYPRLLDDISGELADAGYECLNYVTHQSLVEERAILQEILRRKPAGLILERVMSALPSPNIDIMEQIRLSGICVVSLHAPWGEGNSLCVGDDNYGGGYMLAGYLLGEGRTSLAGIFKSDDMQGIERYRGFISALRDLDIPIPENRIQWYSTQDLPALASGDLLEHFVSKRLGDANGIVCYNDEVASQLLRILQNHRRIVPDEVAVVSFDNSYLCDMGPIGITSLRHERHAVGRTAARTLLAHLYGRSARSAWLPWTLTKRHSG